MRAVGNGRGDYVAETTYRYVGEGHGDLQLLEHPKGNASSPNRIGYLIAGTFCLLILGFLAVLFMPLQMHFPSFLGGGPTVLLGGRRSCMIWGQPQVVTFDGAEPFFAGAGEFWLIKSKDISIQVRKAPTRDSLGLSAITKLVIAGSFLESHTITVEPLLNGNGKIRIDNKEVLKLINFQHDLSGQNGGLAILRYDREGEVLDESCLQKPKAVIHINMPETVALEVFRWENHLDIKVSMTAAKGGQDGICGNFNGDEDDDAASEVYQRLGSRVDGEDLLFAIPSTPEVDSQMDTMLSTRCLPDMLLHAETRCREVLGSDAKDGPVRACVYDRCFGHDTKLLRALNPYPSG